MKSRNPPPISLRQLILLWLLPGVALLLIASGTSTYLVAWQNANDAYDRSLYNLAIALSNQVRVHKGRATLDLESQGQQILVTDKFDRISYAVYGPRGELLGGEEGVFPAEAPMSDRFAEGYVAFDSTLHERPVRGVVLLANHEGVDLTVVVAETLVKRETQVGKILLGIIVPNFLLSVATLWLILFGVKSGLKPLDVLRNRLARRTPIDLRPLGAGTLPVELQPLALEIDRLLERLNVALGAQRHFVSDAAHQLRTPIAALQAQLESVIQERNGDPRLQPLLAAAQRLAHMVNQLLALARAEPSGMPLLQPVDLKSLIEAHADTWVRQAIARDIDLGFELAPAEVSGAAILLGELLNNLADNALRYTPRGGQVTIRCDKAPDGSGRLAIEDSGPGIPVELRERVFERFFRIDGSAAEGCGLGLAIVRQIANQHGATIRIADAVAGGALIELVFPPLPANPEQGAPPSGRAEPAP